VKLFDYDEADPSIDKLLIGTGEISLKRMLDANHDGHPEMLEIVDWNDSHKPVVVARVRMDIVALETLQALKRTT